MFNKKTKLKLTDFECNLLWGGMNEFRNMLLADGIVVTYVTRNFGGAWEFKSNAKSKQVFKLGD